MSSEEQDFLSAAIFPYSKVVYDNPNPKGNNGVIFLVSNHLYPTRISSLYSSFVPSPGYEIWPKEIAPYQVHLIGLDLFDEKIKAQAEKIYQDLLDKKIEVLFDDRIDTMAGAKFADADLIGNPIRLVLSKRSLENGGIELKNRNEDKSEIIPLDSLIDKIIAK